MGYTVNEMIKPQTDWLTHVADVKRVGYGEKAAFRTKLEGVTAFIQAKGATPARSKIAHKQVALDTIAVSARPVINLYELRTGRVQMADLIRDASYEMHVKQIQYIQQVLSTAAASWESMLYRPSLMATTQPPFRRDTTVMGSPEKHPRLNRKASISSSSVSMARMMYSRPVSALFRVMCFTCFRRNARRRSTGG